MEVQVALGHIHNVQVGIKMGLIAPLHSGIVKRLSRRPHKPKAVGSNPTSATNIGK